MAEILLLIQIVIMGHVKHWNTFCCVRHNLYIKYIKGYQTH